MNRMNQYLKFRLVINTVIFCFVSSMVWGQETLTLSVPLSTPLGSPQVQVSQPVAQQPIASNQVNGSDSPSSPQVLKSTGTPVTNIQNQEQGLSIQTNAAFSRSTSDPGNSGGSTTQFPSYTSAGVNVTPKFGNAVRSIGIQVPEGVNGIQPSLAIVYSSNFQNGLMGVGWDIPLSYIQRSVRRGVPQYTTSDEFIMVQGGGQSDLVFDSGNNYYRAKIEKDFSKMEFDSSANSWVTTDRNGTRYFFGSDDSLRKSQQYDSSNSSEVFRWYLDKVEDVLGNTMAITYEKDQNQVYPKLMEYTSNSIEGLSAFAEVEFQTSARNISSSSYESGFLVKTSQMIDRVIVRAQGQMIREYHINYTQSAATLRDLVSSIVQYGSDGVTALEPIQMTYYNNRSFTSEPATGIPLGAKFGLTSNVTGNPVDFGVRAVDVNSDGFPDLVQNYRDYFNGAEHSFNRTWINQKNNSWLEDLTWKSRHNTFANNYAGLNISEGMISAAISGLRPLVGVLKENVDFGLRFVDINGDSRIDIMESSNHQEQRKNSSGGYESVLEHSSNSVFINNDSGWNNDDDSWDLPTGVFLNSNWRHWTQSQAGGDYAWDLYQYTSLGNQLIDVNNDGYVDLVTSYKIPETSATTGDLIRSHDVYLNKLKDGSTGWELAPQWEIPTVDPDYTNFYSGATLVDVNGDQLPDIYYNDGNVRDLYINTGRGWQHDPGSDYLNSCFLISGSNVCLGNLTDGSTQFADINGDGLVDMVVTKGSFAEGSRALINTGAGWAEDTALTLDNADFRNYGTKLMDVNADALLDYVVFFGDGGRMLYLNNGDYLDLLKSVDNSYGGVTTLEYGSSHGKDIDGNQIVHTFMPFSIPIVKKTYTSNGFDTYETLFYSDFGAWYAPLREFWGFQNTYQRSHEGVLNHTIYYVDEFRKGEPGFVEVFDASGQLLSQSIKTVGVDTVNMPTGVGFVYTELAWDVQENISEQFKITATQFEYGDSPQLGNVTKVIQLGEVVEQSPGNRVPVDIDPTDNRIIETSYTKDLNQHILGLPKNIKVKDANGTTVRESWLYYDLNNSDIDAIPSKGLLTKMEEWNDQGANPVTQMWYNGLGNIIETHDPNTVASSATDDFTTKIMYDSTLGIFPWKITNALGHVIENCYFGVNESECPETDPYSGLWGQLKSTKDVDNNQVVKYSYDALGRSKKVVQPGDTFALPSVETLYTYFTSNYLISEFRRIKSGDVATLASHICIDGLGRKIFEKQSTGNPQEFVLTGHARYDSRNQPLKVFNPYITADDPIPFPAPSDASIKYSEMKYDGVGRLTQHTNPDGTIRNSVYDIWTVFNYDENGHLQSSESDAFGRLVKTYQWKGADGRHQDYSFDDYTNHTPISTSYVYDTEGNLKEVTDHEGNKTFINYDSLGRKLNMTDPDMGYWQYTLYDANGNLKTQKDAKDKEIFFDYDDLNRLKSKKDNVNLDVTYTYDAPTYSHPIGDYATGRLTQSTYGLNHDDQTQSTYDQRGRVIESKQTINSMLYELRWNYDALDRVEEMEYPNGDKLHYKYNERGLIESISDDPDLFTWNDIQKSKKFALIQNNQNKPGLVTRILDFVLGVKPAYAQTTIVDDTDSGFSIVGFWGGPSTSTSGYEGSGYRWVSPNGSGSNIATWSLNVSGGDYLVEVKWTAHSNRASNAKYVVNHSSGSDPQIRDQQSGGGVWQTLGTYNFNAGSATVDLIDDANNGYSIADAVRFTFQGGGGGSNTPPTNPGNFNASNPTSSTFAVNWNASSDSEDGTVSGYELDVATDVNFTNIVHTTSSIAGTATQYTVTSGLSASILYHVRLRAYDSQNAYSGYENDSITTQSNGGGGNVEIILGHLDAIPTNDWRQADSFADDDHNNDGYFWSWVGSGDDVIQWQPNIPTTGVYKVSYWIPGDVDGNNRLDWSEGATYTINHANGQTPYPVDFRNEPQGQWLDMGNYTFNSGTSGYIELTDSASSHMVVADGMRFELVGGGGSNTPPTNPGNFNASNPTSSTFAVNWNASSDSEDGTVSGYELDVATDVNFTNIVHTTSSISGSATQYTVTSGLGASIIYHVRLRAYDSQNAYSGYENDSITTQSNGGGGNVEIILGHLDAIPTNDWRQADSFADDDHNNDGYFWSWVGSGDDVIQWQPNIPTTGVYKVSYWIPGDVDGNNRLDWSEGATYTINHANGQTPYPVDFRNEPQGQWLDMGNYTFNSGTSGYIELTDSASSHMVVADGMRFELVGGGGSNTPPTNPGNFNASNPTSSTFAVNWNASSDSEDGTVSGYELDVATDVNFTNIVHTTSSISGSATQYTVTSGLGASIIYHVRLRAYDSQNAYSGYENDSITTQSNGGGGNVEIILGHLDAIPTNDWRQADSFADDDHNNDGYFWSWVGSGDDVIQWQPNIPTTGVYKVSYWIPGDVDGNNRLDWSEGATYTINHANGQTPYPVDFRNEPQGQWLDMGNYTFNSGTSGYIELTDSASSHMVVADGMRFELVGGGGSNTPPTNPGNFNASNPTSSTFAVNWNASSDSEDGTVSGYELDVATDVNFTNIVHTTSSISGSATQYTVTSGLGASIIYHVRLRAYDSQNAYSGYENDSITTQSNGGGGNVEIILGHLDAIPTNDWRQADSFADDDHNNDGYFWSWAGSGDDVIQWQPNIPTTGVYKVSYWIPGDVDGNNRLDWSEGATYTINHANGQTPYPVDFRNEPQGQWLDMGNYTFNSGTSGYIELTDSASSHMVVADGMKFELVNGGGSNGQFFIEHIEYEPSGQKKSVLYGNGTKTTYSYDDNLRLETLLTQDIAQMNIQELNYTYDGVGNVRTITDVLKGETQTFVYDHLNRLDNATGDYEGGSNVVRQYGYNAIGNLEQKDNKALYYPSAGSVNVAGVDDAGPHAVNQVDNDVVKYDDNGNMTSYGVESYEYDVENRLQRLLENGSEVANFEYDDSGERIVKITNGSDERHFVDGVYETFPGEIVRHLYVGGMRFASVTNSNIRFYHGDHLGSASVSTDESGNFLEESQYLPFGEFDSDHQPVGNQEGIHYTGQYKDAEGSLYYYGARVL